jgi:hypothetical protein
MRPISFEKTFLFRQNFPSKKGVFLLFIYVLIACHFVTGGLTGCRPSATKCHIASDALLGMSWSLTFCQGLCPLFGVIENDLADP